MRKESIHLYIDDSGARNPDHRASALDSQRNWFALGGVVLNAENSKRISDDFRAIAAEFEITTPMQSSKIRMRKAEFSWLAHDEDKASRFYSALDGFFADIPAYIAGCVVDKNGYEKRYKEKFGDNRWHLCKTAYVILVERTTKYARSVDRKLEVIIERTGRTEDRNIKSYHRGLLDSGVPFDEKRSAKYEPLTQEQLRESLVKNPRFVTKKSRLSQVADLSLYPLVAVSYNPSYRPFTVFVENGKLLPNPDVPDDNMFGLKKFCFDE